MEDFPTLERMSNTMLRHVIRDLRLDAEWSLTTFTAASFAGQPEGAEILLSAALVCVEEHEGEAQRRALPVSYWPKRRAILNVLAQVQEARTSQQETNGGVIEFTEIDMVYARAFGIRLD